MRSGFLDIDDQHRNPNNNEGDHLVGQLTTGNLANHFVCSKIPTKAALLSGKLGHLLLWAKRTNQLKSRDFTLDRRTLLDRRPGLGY